MRASGSYSMLEGPNRKSGRIPFAGAIVVIVTVIAVDDVPFSETELGDTLHTDRVGAPLHVSATA